jgi:hypothetical protein
MIRRRTGVAFGGNAFDDASDEANPMESVANLVDAMLVFAVALMLALITRMGVDLTAVQLDSSQMEEVDISEMIQSEDNTDSDSSGDEQYYEVGRVYKNASGDMYLIS